MGVAFIIFTLIIDAWIFFSVFRSLAKGEIDPIWRKRIWVFLILGVGLAVFFAFIHKRDQPSLRTSGFPIPFKIAKLQKDVWTEYNPPHSVQIFSQVVDFITGFAVALIPLKIVRFWREVKDAKKQPA